ncbi:MAG: signal peptidase II, partial [Bifidobacteriaceae bacterium]|nr:signal peptidase II [Bifidobacteriaceae bacterium]
MQEPSTGDRTHNPPDDPPDDRAASPGAGPSVATPDRRFHRQIVILAAVASGVLALDQITKAWAVAALAEGRTVSLIGSFLELRLVRNPGAAFSMGESLTWAFTILSTAVVVAVVAIARRVKSTPWAVILGLLLAGAAGNLADRIFRPPAPGRGHVVDFIDYAGRFVGNVADI